MTETAPGMRRVVVGAARHVEDVCREINAAMVASNWSDPKIFIYQGELHYLESGSGNGNGPVLRRLTINLLRGICISRFRCVKPERPVPGTDEDADEDDGAVEVVAAPTFSTARVMPQDVAGMVLETPDYWADIPHLHALVSLPFFRRDGVLIDTHGYDEASHIYYWKPSGFDLPRPVPDVPSQAAIEWARHWLCEELFVDFPFAGAADKANTVGMLLSPFVMNLIDCPLPLFVFTADNPGVGKSLLSEICSRVLTSDAPRKAPWPSKEEEFEKKIFGAFASAQTAPMVIWDNVPEGTAVDSPLLATLHTAREYSGRTLGKSDMRTFRNDKIWAVTGNSLTTSGDMARRSVYCSLAATGPHPEDRPPESFRQPKLRQWVAANRATLVLACLTLVRAWQAAGEPLPPASVPRMGDYAPWVETIGGVLQVAGVDGFLGNVRERRENSDEGVAEAEALFMVVAGKFGASPDLRTYPEFGTAFTCADVVSALRNMDDGMRDALQFPPMIDKQLVHLYSMDTKILSAAIGRWFGRHDGRWQGSSPARRVLFINSKHNVKQYRMEERHEVGDPAAELLVLPTTDAPTVRTAAPAVADATREVGDRRR